MALGMKDLLIDRDPLDTSAVWEELCTYTCMSGRRGAVISAIGAIDMALWDIKGKALGLPCYKLLGGAHRNAIVPYASLQPSGPTVQEYGKSLVDWLLRARECSTRIAAGEWQNTRFEFIELMDRGLIDVVQPDVGRAGRLTEALRVCHWHRTVVA